MTLPYQNAKAGPRALIDLQKLLRDFGCSKFGSMIDDEVGELLVQFEHRGRPVQIKASFKGYSEAWLRENPWSDRRHLTQREHELKALQIGSVAVYSIARDWIKGQVMAIETGMLTFESAFLGQMLLADGRSVLESVQSGNLLPAPTS